jgi:hypothetical protein
MTTPADRYSTDPHSADPYGDWDAAYVLGSLPPEQRRDFELHLEGCERCAAAVAEFAALPGLLSRVRSDQVVLDVGAQPAVPASVLPGLVKAAVRHRHRVRVLVGTLTASLAAIAAAIALAIPFVLSGAGPSTIHVALGHVVASPLQADITLVEHDWGTRIDMNCRYDLANGPVDYQAGTTEYALDVTDTAGVTTELASWMAAPGSTVRPAATTSLLPSDIRSFEVRAVASGQILLRGHP